MRLLARRKTPAEELKNAAIAALADALDTEKRTPKPGLSGARAVATGAVIYSAGFAAIRGRRFVREHLSSGPDDEHAEDEFRDEERGEPDAEGYDVDEEIEDEPEPSEEDEDEPEAYEDEDEEPQADEVEREASEEDDGEPEASEDDGQSDHAATAGGDESSSESPTPLPERKPVRRAARKKGAQPSLKLPRQRRPRLPVSRDRA